MSAPKRGCRRQAAFAVCAICLGLLPFVLIECVLRLTGLGVPTSYQDPFVGFSQSFPLFEFDAQAGEYHTARHHHYFFGLQHFPATKKPKTFRAFCLGGSTVLGHPYDAETALPRWLEIELAGCDPSSGYEVVNCGGMSYASYRLIPILQEVLNYDPDLIVVMTGHNEFLEERTYHAVKQRSAARGWIDDRLSSLRIVTLARRATGAARAGRANSESKTTLDPQVDARLDHVSGYASYRRDEQWWKDVTAHFTWNLREMVRLCREAGVPVLLVNPGCNLRDCPPFKSEHRPDLTPQELAAWTGHFEQGSAVEAAYPADALELYRQAEAIDDQHAQLVYRIARCLDRLGRFEEAREAYSHAKELDVCPLRILNVMQQTVFEVAEETSTPLVDAAGLLEQQSLDGIAGFDWYVDQVHPSIRGQQLIARAIASKLQNSGKVLSSGQPWSKDERRKAYRRHMLELGDSYLAAGRRRVEWLEKWARRDRSRDDTLPLDARAMLDLGNSYVEFAEYEKSQVPYAMALQDDPASAARLLERALQLFQSGRSSAAERLANIVLELSSDQSTIGQAHLALAVLAYEDGRMEVGAEHAKRVRSDTSSFDSFSNAWLEELPGARSLFD